MNDKYSEDGGHLSAGEPGIDDFMTCLENEGHLTEEDLEITEYWFTDYSFVEVTRLPQERYGEGTDRTASTNSTSTNNPSTTP